MPDLDPDPLLVDETKEPAEARLHVVSTAEGVLGVVLTGLLGTLYALLGWLWRAPEAPAVGLLAYGAALCAAACVGAFGARRAVATVLVLLGAMPFLAFLDLLFSPRARLAEFGNLGLLALCHLLPGLLLLDALRTLRRRRSLAIPAALDEVFR